VLLLHSLLSVLCVQRENYLGHSLLAPVGRWQMGKDLTWYAKQKAPPGAAGTAAGAASAQQTALELERAAIKAEEEERRLEALGIRKRVPKPPAPVELDPREAAQLFGRTKTEPTDAATAAGGASSDADRVSGLGFRADDAAQMQATGAGTGAMQLEAGATLEGSMGGAGAAAAAAGGVALPASSASDFAALSEESLLADPSLDAASRAILMEAADIRAKEAKKRHKKEKKEKKEKKSKKERKRDKEREGTSSKRRSHSSSSSRSRSPSPPPSSSRDRHRDRERRDSRSRSRSRDRDSKWRDRDDRERR